AAVASGGADGAVEIELLGRTLAREAPQAPQRHLDVARAELARGVEVAVFARLPDLGRAAVPAGLRADAHAFGIEPAVTERRGAVGADPLVAALVPRLLLAQPLLQGLEQLLPAAQGFDAAFFLYAEQPLGDLLQPFGRQPGHQLFE